MEEFLANHCKWLFLQGTWTQRSSSQSISNLLNHFRFSGKLHCHKLPCNETAWFSQELVSIFSWCRRWWYIRNGYLFVAKNDFWKFSSSHALVMRKLKIHHNNYTNECVPNRHKAFVGSLCPFSLVKSILYFYLGVSIFPSTIQALLLKN